MRGSGAIFGVGARPRFPLDQIRNIRRAVVFFHRIGTPLWNGPHRPNRGQAADLTVCWGLAILKMFDAD